MSANSELPQDAGTRYVDDNSLNTFGQMLADDINKAQIIAEKGPIVIGNDNLIEEGVIIKNSNEETLYVGNENIFEVQSQFEGDFSKVK